MVKITGLSNRVIKSERASSQKSWMYFVQVIFLIGNKSDLDAQRDVTYEEAKQFAEENGTKYIILGKQFQYK